MATVYGVNRTLANTPTGSNITDPGLLGGNVKCMLDQYEASSLAAGSVIEMGDELPKGARVLEITMTTDALGSATIDVGDYEDADRYLSAISVSSASISRIDEIDGRQYEIDETYTGKTVGSGTDRQVTLTTASASITGTIKLEILYTYE